MALCVGMGGDDVLGGWGGGGGILRALSINRSQAPTLLTLRDPRPGQSQGIGVVYPAKYYFESFPP